MPPPPTLSVWESYQAGLEIWEIVQNIGENNWEPPSSLKKNNPTPSPDWLWYHREITPSVPLPPLHPLKQDKKHMWTQCNAMQCSAVLCCAAGHWRKHSYTDSSNHFINTNTLAFIKVLILLIPSCFSGPGLASKFLVWLTCPISPREDNNDQYYDEYFQRHSVAHQVELEP